MKNFVFCVSAALCLVAPAAASATQWELVHNEGPNHSFYIDPSRVKKVGNSMRVWELWANRVKGSFLMMLREYDCRQERTRVLELTSHDNLTGQGNARERTNVEDPWIFVPPGAPIEKLMKRACR